MILPSGRTATFRSPSRPFILRPVATSLLMVAILLAGIVAYRVLPLSALPEEGSIEIHVVPRSDLTLAYAKP